MESNDQHDRDEDDLYRRVALRSFETDDIPGTIAELLDPHLMDFRGENAVADLFKQNGQVHEDLSRLFENHKRAMARLDDLAESGAIGDPAALDDFADENSDFVEAYGRHIVKFSDLYYSTAQLNPPPTP